MEFGAAGVILASTLGKYVRGLCTQVSGPHRLENGWDLNCRFGQTEFWILLKRSGVEWIILVDSVWDFRHWLGLASAESDLNRFHTELSQWLLDLPEGSGIMKNKRLSSGNYVRHHSN